jgi:hypothetical protein
MENILISTEPCKDEAQTFIEKPSPYSAVNTFHLCSKSKQFMLHGAEVAVCSQINTNHINTVWAQRTVVEF